jgi:hypothetical protein
MEKLGELRFGTTLRSALCLSCLLVTSCPPPGPPPPSWTVVAQGLREGLLSIAGRNASEVWAVGADKGAGPIVLRFDGTRWERRATGTRGTLWWVHAAQDGTTFMAGTNSTILRVTDAGFTRVATPGLARHTVFGLWAAGANEAYAVGSEAGRSGFLWRWNGTRFEEVDLGRALPTSEDGTTPGLFKVWGDGAGTIWVVGGRGVILRGRAGVFERIESGTTQTLFTVTGASDRVVAVGGAGSGVIVEREGEGAFAMRAPDGAPLLQGVSLARSGAGFAGGFNGSVYERNSSGAWSRVESAPSLPIESLHAAWVDDEGGAWFVGGGVLGPALDRGAITYRGRRTVPRFEESVATDGGMDGGDASEGGVAPAVCPEDQVDPAPMGSIARRWNEAMLWAIRRDIPKPVVHARNLFHVSAALWDAWAAYDATADGVFYRTRATSAAVAAARAEAMSYAAYRVLNARYSPALATGAPVSQACFRALMRKLSLDPDATGTDGDSPRAVGNRVAAAVLAATIDDGANERNAYADTTMHRARNPPLVFDQPGVGEGFVDPAEWQPLVLAESVTQNGIPLGAGVQEYIGPQWDNVRPFAIERARPSDPYFDPGMPPGFDARMGQWALEVLRLSAALDPSLPAMIDISPGAYGNNPLGTNEGRGHAMNPTTGMPYASQRVRLGDFGRVMAEYWADGPKSETPPGHWNKIANEITAHAMFSRRVRGMGAPIDPLEWDVKVYLAMNGAMHDAAIVAWGIKRRFLASRPITLIRYMGGLGQRSDPMLPRYHRDGLVLEPGVVELITAQSSAPGQRHAHLARYVGQVAVFTWRGEPGERRTEIGGAGWLRAVEWVPFQLRSFVTPAFPGFISGHSTYSRAGAEVLAAITGSEFFPGGLAEFVAREGGYLTFERGPSAELRLQWGTYFDAADQAGQSRLWGGIHISPDDFVGRRMGREVGLRALTKATTFFDGTAVP